MSRWVERRRQQVAAAAARVAFDFDPSRATTGGRPVISRQCQLTTSLERRAAAACEGVPSRRRPSRGTRVSESMAIELGGNMAAFRGAEKDDCEAGPSPSLSPAGAWRSVMGARYLIGCGLLQVQLG